MREYSCNELTASNPEDCRFGELCFVIRTDSERSKRGTINHSHIEEKAHLVQLPEVLRSTLQKMRQDKKKLSGKLA